MVQLEHNCRLLGKVLESCPLFLSLLYYKVYSVAFLSNECSMYDIKMSAIRCFNKVLWCNKYVPLRGLSIPSLT